MSTIFLLTVLACSGNTNRSPTPIPSSVLPTRAPSAPSPTPIPTSTPLPSANMPAELRGQTAQDTARAIATFVSSGKERLFTVEDVLIESSAVSFVTADRVTGKAISLEKLPGVVLRYTIRLAKTGVLPSVKDPEGLEILAAASDILRFTADHIVYPIYFSDDPRAQAFQYLLITIVDPQGTPTAFVFTRWDLLEQQMQTQREKRDWFKVLNERLYGTIIFQGSVHMKALRR